MEVGDEDETWLHVKDFENYYAVSNLGRLKRLSRLSKNSGNDSYRVLDERLKRTYLKNKRRYITCQLLVDGETSYRQLHRMVLRTFKPNINEKLLEVNHIDGDKHNNRLSNLEWVTRRQNALHARDNGLLNIQKGIKNGKAKITEQIVHDIRKLRKDGLEYSMIADITNTTKKIVGDIIRKRTWKHLEE